MIALGVVNVSSIVVAAAAAAVAGADSFSTSPAALTCASYNVDLQSYLIDWQFSYPKTTEKKIKIKIIINTHMW